MESVELSEEAPLRTQFTVDDLDIEILPLIYEIIRRFVYSNILIIRVLASLMCLRSTLKVQQHVTLFCVN